MKRFLVLIFCLVFMLQLHGRERIYLSTDRQAYVAGDLVWCSAFSLGGDDVRGGIAYVELVSTDGTALQARLSLTGGRGAGVLQLPASLPTGNYLLCAYTSTEDDPNDILRDARVLSVFNGFSSARVRGGVKVGDTVIPSPASQAGPLRILATPAARGEIMQVELDNRSGSAASLSVSVCHEDALVPTVGKGIADFCSHVVLGGKESEGDIIRARLVGPDRTKAFSSRLFGMISSPGSAEDLYTAVISSDGKVSFRTNTIFGHRDLVCEVTGLEEPLDCHLELDSPFLGVAASDVPQLVIDPTYEKSILDRIEAIPSSRAAAADTLLEFLPKRESLLFRTDDPDCIRYRMEDYTPMNTFHECVIEYMAELRWRRGELLVLKSARKGMTNSFVSNVLVLVDGVPVLDHGSIIEMDASLLSEVDIYSRSFLLGARSYDAVVSLITAKGNISHVKFPDSVRILDFEGASYPLAYQQAPLEGTDLRQTVYWHPAVEVGAGEVRRLEVVTPSYPGRFRIVAEGLDHDGRPIRQETTVEVR